MDINWQPFSTFISQSSSFILMTHIRPDADALGSQLGLALGLEYLGKKVKTVIPSSVSPRYRFMDQGKRVDRFIMSDESLSNYEAIIVVDTGTWNQIGEFGSYMRSRDIPKAVIDHHRTQDDLGGIRFVDTSAEACGKLIYDALRYLNVPLTEQISSLLFAAIAMDTGWFRHSSTNESTFGIAKELVAAGANPNLLYDHLFEHNSQGRIKLIGRVIERLSFALNDRVAFLEVYLTDFPATGSVPSDSEDLIDYPRSIDGVEIAILFIEQSSQTTKVSFRSRLNIDIDKIAEEFGGGGHRLAAGALINAPIAETRKRVLQALEKLFV